MGLAEGLGEGAGVVEWHHAHVDGGAVDREEHSVALRAGDLVVELGLGLGLGLGLPRVGIVLVGDCVSVRVSVSVIGDCVRVRVRARVGVRVVSERATLW